MINRITSPIATLLAALTLSILLAAAPVHAGPGYALSLNGTNAFVDMQAAVIPTNGEFTVECWAFCPPTNGYREILSQGSPGNAFYIGTSSTGKLRLGDAWSTSLSFPFGAWHHFAVVKSTNTIFYLDGIGQLTNAAPITNPVASSGLRLGRQYGGIGECWPGQIDEVRIWSVARNADQIFTNKNRALTGTELGLKAYWRCDENSGTTLADATTNAYTGTLTNGPAWTLSGVPFIPDATTGGATNISLTGATLTGTVNPGNQPTTVWFQWGTDTNYGNLTTTASLPATNASLPVSIVLGSLTPGLTWHFRLVATNSAGLSYGSDQSFATLPPGPPTVISAPATGVLPSTATLHGTVNPNGLSTTAWFEWGTTTNYGNATAVTGLGSGVGPIPLTSGLTGLVRNATYHYRVAAMNSAGTRYGADLAFRTGGGTNSVTTLADGGPGSLRQAISDAVPGDFIAFPKNGTITLTNGELLLDKDLNLNGPGATHLALSGNLSNRVFNISSNATVILSGLTIRDGKSSDGIIVSNAVPGFPGQDGGGIYNAGTLGMTDCVITNCAAGNGSESWGSGSGGLGGSGGGIYNVASVTMTACMISGNAGGAAGTGLSSLSGTGGHGGGICNLGTLTGSNCVVASNSAGNFGIFMYQTNAIPLGSGGSGGGIYNSGTLTLTAATINANKGGDGSFSVFPTSSGPGCPGGSGGGIFNSNAGTLTLTACTVSGNNSGSGGTGSSYNSNSSAPGGPGGHGGGVYSAGSLTLTLCTLSGNSGGTGGLGSSVSWSTAPAPGAGGPGGNGGGIHSSGTFTLTACTISGNLGGPGGIGGALILGGTIPGTGGTGGAGGGVFNAAAAASANVRNALLAQNFIGPGGPGGTIYSGQGAPGPSGPNGSAPDTAGSFTSQGHNLIGRSDGGTGFTHGIAGDLVGTVAVPLDPQLRSLADNGGPTLTHGFSVTSQAFNAGDDSLTNNLPTDQRGAPRIFDAHVDIGAFELAFSTPSPITLPAVAGDNSLVTGTAGVTLHSAVNPGGIPIAGFFQFGTTTNYGGSTPMFQFGAAINPVPFSALVNNLASGVTYHYRIVVTNDLGIFYGDDATLTVRSLYRPGDLNGDDLVDRSELNLVLQSYWAQTPPQMTRLTGLGRGAFQFGLSNAVGLDFSVLASTNLVDWELLSPVSPVFQVTDPDASRYPHRFYRLRWP